MPRRAITAAERKHMNNLRRNGLRVASVYEVRLEKARRKELQRVLDLCRDYADPQMVAAILESELNESGYLYDWWTGLWTEAGLPRAKSTARDLRQAKAAGEEDVWLYTLRTYATERAGSNIVGVTGTWKDSLVKLVRTYLSEDAAQSIERLTDKIYRGYLATLEKWQCRRIAQTEAMIGMAEAGDAAAKTLDVKYLKQWCTSGMDNVRPSHQLVDGLIVDENEPFSLPGGLLMYPHDSSMGADASEIINCACDVIRRPK